MPGFSMANIAIIDDHPSTREGLAIRIGLESDLEVCGEAADVVDGLELIRRDLPHLAVVDISLKSGNGIELIKQVKRSHPEVKMLVWSMYDESLYAERALRAGALGYINKENVTDTIISAIRTVLRGEIYLSPEMSSTMLTRIVSGGRDFKQSPVEKLSDRELETFNLIGHGLNTAAIAKKLVLSPRTVETYRARIKEKLGIGDLSELSREATRWVIENG
jgi:DNA-binding NarL/FixJ family response regulator